MSCRPMARTVAGAADRAGANGLRRLREGGQFDTADAFISTHEPSSRMHRALKLYMACMTCGRAMPGNVREKTPLQQSISNTRRRL